MATPVSPRKQLDTIGLFMSTPASSNTVQKGIHIINHNIFISYFNVHSITYMYVKLARFSVSRLTQDISLLHSMTMI